MSELTDKIRMAQVMAGEDIVIQHLKELGIIDNDGNPVVKKTESNVIPFKEEDSK